MRNELAKTAVDTLKNYMNLPRIQKIFDEMIGARKGIFTNTIVNVARGNEQLLNCTPKSIVDSAITAAGFNLSVDPTIGHAAIVPYGTTAQFQIMYKGITQLCVRSGQYADINCTEIYADELLSHNPITGVVKFKDPSGYKLRDGGKDKDVIGHYASFRLKSGFEKSDYMTHAQAMAHGEKYSKAFQYDLKNKKKSCPWSVSPIRMCNKTVYLRLMRAYAIMSIELQSALEFDKSFEAAQAAADQQIGDEQGSDPIDADMEPKLVEFVCRECGKLYNLTAKDGEDKRCECGEAFIVPVGKTKKKTTKTKKKTTKKKVESKTTDTAPAEDEFFYECLECGNKFDDPKVTGIGDDAKPCCPNTYDKATKKACFSPNIKKLQE